MTSFEVNKKHLSVAKNKKTCVDAEPLASNVAVAISVATKRTGHSFALATDTLEQAHDLVSFGVDSQLD